MTFWCFFRHKWGPWSVKLRFYEQGTPSTVWMRECVRCAQVQLKRVTA